MTPADLGMPQLAVDDPKRWITLYEIRPTGIRCRVCGVVGLDRNTNWPVAHCTVDANGLSECGAEWLSHQFRAGKLTAVPVTSPRAIQLVANGMTVTANDACYVEPWVCRIFEKTWSPEAFFAWARESPERLHAIRAFVALGKDPMILWKRSRRDAQCI